MTPSHLTKAVILSAGLGTRLGARTQALPKVMVPLAGKPMLEHHIAWLRDAGITEFFINLHYLPDAITGYFGDGSPWGVRITYAREESLLGTAGSLHGFRGHLDSTFLVQYGDVYSRLDIARFFAFHREHAAAATLAVHPSSHPHDSDIVELAPDARIRAIHHKPGHAKFGNLGNAGAYLLEPSALNYLAPHPQEEDFCRHIFPKMLSAAERIFGYDTPDLLLDVGTPDRLAWIANYLETHP